MPRAKWFANESRDVVRFCKNVWRAVRFNWPCFTFGVCCALVAVSVAS